MPKRIEHTAFVLDNFSYGMDWTSPPYQLMEGFVANAQNVSLDYFKAMQKRGGCSKLYTAIFGASAAIHSLYEYWAPDGEVRLLIGGGQRLGYWDTGISTWHYYREDLTDAARLFFATHAGFCFITNGVDANFKLYNDEIYLSLGVAKPETACISALGTSTGLTGKFQHAYAYKRSYPEELIGTISDPSTLLEATDDKIDVTYWGSSDPQIDKIIIYRTLDQTDGASSMFFKVTEVDNLEGFGVYTDSTPDSDLTVEAYYDHTPPPKSKFICSYKNRMIYANCPDETNGGSLFLFSSINAPEVCPSTNYQYFDRQDGNEITAIGALPDYLVVFKKNKIAVLAGEFTQWSIISHGVGSISPYILQYEDKIVFLSEEGWKATDGAKVYDIGKRLQSLVTGNYFTVANGANFSCAYYPYKHQMQWLLYSSLLTNYIFCGHWLSQLYSEVESDFGAESLTVGWTYHYYPYQTFTILSNWTDSEGIQQIIAGTNDGYVYILDSGFTDNEEPIAVHIDFGWTNLGMPGHITKTLRWLTPAFKGGAELNGLIYYDTDFANTDNNVILIPAPMSYVPNMWCGSSYLGMQGLLVTNLACNDKATGKVFRFRIEEESTAEFIFLSLGGGFRIEGVR